MAEERDKYFLLDRLPQEVALTAITTIASTLSTTYPQSFSASDDHLCCHLTGERIELNDAANLATLALQIQPDLAIVVREADGTDRNAALYVCAPSNWSPSEKIGRSFFDTHQPVPGFEKANAAAPQLVKSIVEQGPFVRFVWGLESDDRLSHHPEAPPIRMQQNGQADTSTAEGFGCGPRDKPCKGYQGLRCPLLHSRSNNPRLRSVGQTQCHGTRCERAYCQ